MKTTNESIDRFREQQNNRIDLMKKELLGWIALQNGPIPSDIDVREQQFLGPYTEINSALLETAIDRMIALLGSDDTKEFLLKAFERRAAAYKKTLV